MRRLICGPRAVIEALRAAPREVHLVLLEDSAAGSDALEREAQRRRVAVRRCPRAELETLAKDLKHQSAIAIAGDYPYLDLERLLERSSASGPDLLLALDQVQDVGNVGSILRSGVSLGATGFLLCRHGGSKITPAAVRVSAGASEHATVARITNLARTLDELSGRGVQILGLDADGTRPLWEADFGRPTTLVLGSEGRGLRRLVRRSCDELLSVPLAGPVESLNVAVTAALALYEAHRQRQKMA